MFGLFALQRTPNIRNYPFVNACKRLTTAQHHTQPANIQILYAQQTEKVSEPRIFSRRRADAFAQTIPGSGSCRAVRSALMRAGIANG